MRVRHCSALVSCVPLNRDFHNEVSEVITIKDPAFRPSFLQFWMENLPAPKEVANPFKAADEQITQLSNDARQAAWERDTLLLAKDVASLGRLFDCEVKSEKSRRCQKILHIRAQNCIGASLVENFMSSSVAYLHGKSSELMNSVDKARWVKAGFVTDGLWRKSNCHPLDHSVILCTNKIQDHFTIDI